MINLILKIFKKGAKYRKKAKPQEKGGEEARGKIPGLFQVGVCGHTSSGKTVFFTMLYEKGRNEPDFRLATLDDLTAKEIHENIRLLKGLKRTEVGGGVRDVQGERRFPDPTSGESHFNFEATLNHRTRFRFTTLEYKGENIALEEDLDSKKSLVDYLSECDCLLFFIEPSVIRSELLRQEQLATFINLMERISNGGFGINIPIGLVVTKSDLLEGFEREDQTVVIQPSYEYLKTRGFESFLKGILNQSSIRNRSSWQGQLRDLLRNLKPFFESLMERTLDFQIFFVSSTGLQLEREEGTKERRTPPEVLRPMGITDPLKWAADRLLLKKKIRWFRKFAKWVFVLSFLWILFYSIPHLLHFRMILPKVLRIEEEVLKPHNIYPKTFYIAGLLEVPSEELDKIAKAYENYAKSKTVQWFFKDFRDPALERKRFYTEVYKQELIKLKIHERVEYFHAVITDTLIALKDSLVEFSSNNPDYLSQVKSLKKDLEKVKEEMEKFQREMVGEPTEEDSDRIRSLDGKMAGLISFCEMEEKRLAIEGRENLMEPIQSEYNSHKDEYRTARQGKDYNFLLKNFPGTLEEFKKKLQGMLETPDIPKAEVHSLIAKIDYYLLQASKWEKSRLMKFKVKGVPPNGNHFLTISTVSGTLYEGHTYEIRLPVSEEETSITLMKVRMTDPVDRITVKGGFAILSLDKQKLEMRGGVQVSIDFLDNYLKDLPELR